jgi:uncharacterized lipoprotein YajG
MRPKHVRFFRFLASAVFLAAALTGCAEKGPILLSIGYQPPQESSAAVKKSIRLSPLRDTRSDKESIVGLRTIPDGQQNDFVVQGTVAGLMQNSIKSAFKARGYSVADAPAWDCSIAGMKPEKSDFQISGEIKTFWFESNATVLTTHMRAAVQLKLCVADARDKKAVRTIETNSVVEQDYIYSHDKIESVFSEAIAGAVDQLFKDEAFAGKAKEETPLTPPASDTPGDTASDAPSTKE